MRSSRHALWLILAVALAIRLAPMFFQRQVGRDIVEYQNLAENILAGRGFILDIKAYWAAPTPVVHYGFHERPLLAPMLLALMRLIAPPFAASQLIGPFLYLAALGLIHQTLRRRIGPGVAFSTGILLALHPALFQLSLAPLSEGASMFTLALIVWAYFSQRSAWLTGLACSLAFLSRPSMLLVAAVFGLAYLIQSIHNRRASLVALFTGFALVGPLWQISLNRAMGAPSFLAPQSFLFRVMSFQDGLHYFHRGLVYPSTAELLKAKGSEVAYLIGLNAVHYARVIVSVEGLGLLIVLMPLACVGLWQSRPLRRFGWLGIIALADLTLYSISWATFDAGRFLCIPYLLLITLTVIGAYEILDRQPLLGIRNAWRSAAFYATMAVALIWLGLDIQSVYSSTREWKLGKFYSNPMAQLEAKPEAAAFTITILQHAARQIQSGSSRKPIVGSNDPWLIYDLTRLPAGKIPFDLQGDEWIRHLERMGATIVALQLADWPEDCRLNQENLLQELANDGWVPSFAQGELQIWIKPTTGNVQPSGRMNENPQIPSSGLEA